MRYTEEHYALLLKSLDQTLHPDEQNQLDQALAQSEDLRREKKSLMALRLALSRQAVSTTPSNFSQVIWQKVQQPKVILLNRWMPQIAAACLILLCTALIGIYTLEGTLSTEALLGIQDLSPEEAYTLMTY